MSDANFVQVPDCLIGIFEQRPNHIDMKQVKGLIFYQVKLKTAFASIDDMMNDLDIDSMKVRCDIVLPFVEVGLLHAVNQFNKEDDVLFANVSHTTLGQV